MKTAALDLLAVRGRFWRGEKERKDHGVATRIGAMDSAMFMLAININIDSVRPRNSISHNKIPQTEIQTPSLIRIKTQLHNY